MPATIQNLNIEQGIPFWAGFRAKNSDDSNKNITGYTARMQLRVSIRSPDIALEATTENAKLVLDPTESTVVIQLTEEDTKSLVYKRYVYDLELVDTFGVPLRFIQGEVTVSPEVTR